MVGAAFVAMFVVYGVDYSFGAFFQPMAAEFGAGRTATSAVFSITAFLYAAFGALSGYMTDRFGPRPVLVVGGVAMGVGLCATSLVHSLWVGYATYGIGVGIGVACGYVPMLAVVGGWFMRRRNTALGIAVAGIGLGTLCVAPFAAALIVRIGWRKAYDVLGVLSMVALLGCAAVARKPPITVGPTPFRMGSAVRTRNFWLLYLSWLLFTPALFISFVFLPSFATTHGIGEVAAATLVGIIGGASVIGRLGLGTLGDRVGVVRLYMACSLIFGLSYVIWLVAGSYPAMVGFAIIMGVGYGGWVALSPAVVAHLFGTEGLGGVLGVLNTSGGFGALIGPPIAGFIIDRTQSYHAAIVFALATATLAFAMLLPMDYSPGAVKSIGSED